MTDAACDLYRIVVCPPEWNLSLGVFLLRRGQEGRSGQGTRIMDWGIFFACRCKAMNILPEAWTAGKTEVEEDGGRGAHGIILGKRLRAVPKSVGYSCPSSLADQSGVLAGDRGLDRLARRIGSPEGRGGK